MPGEGQYTIEARSLGVAGIAGHNYWVLRGPDGMALAELHGLATDRETGRSIPIGTDPARHSLRVHHLVHDRGLAAELDVRPTRETYIADGQPSRTVLAADREEVLARWNAAAAARSPLNALDLDYPRYGFRPQVEAHDRRGASLGDEGSDVHHAGIGPLLEAAGRGNAADPQALTRTLADSSQGRAWLQAGQDALERGSPEQAPLADAQGERVRARQSADPEPAARSIA